MDSRFELSDYRAQVNDLYARVRSLSDEPQAAWAYWREARRALLADHPQSPLTQADRAAGRLPVYFDYDPNWRFILEVDQRGAHDILEVPLESDGLMRMERLGRIEFPAEGRPQRLAVYWILGYGGGLFLPFRDATNRHETFQGGRYLLDGIKGADMGREGDKLVIDFNFSYNPSCAYSPQWQCPLPPAENWLTVPIPAGERRYSRAVGPPLPSSL